MTPTTMTCDSSRGRKRHEDCGSDWSHWVFTCLDCGVTETFASWERMKLFGCRHYGWPTEDDLKRRNEYGAERDVQRRLDAALKKLPQTV